VAKPPQERVRVNRARGGFWCCEEAERFGHLPWNSRRALLERVGRDGAGQGYRESCAKPVEVGANSGSFSSQELRCNESWRSTDLALRSVKSLGEAEVNEDQLWMWLKARDEIARLDISMDDVLAVCIGEGRRCFREQEMYLLSRCVSKETIQMLSGDVLGGEISTSRLVRA
jgi:hypothetical protein